MSKSSSSSVTVSRLGVVSVRGSDRVLGFVSRVEWPVSRDGRSWVEDVWEARSFHMGLTVGQFFPTFGTRREAVAFLAERAGLSAPAAPTPAQDRALDVDIY